MICALVLAAGRARRMGAQKLLLPIGDRPAIARIVDEVLAGPVAEVVVVVGTDGGRIADALAGRRVTLVANPDPAGEMLSSVRCGLRAMPEACTAALVVLGDQPSLTAGLVAALAGAHRATGRGLVVPTYRGRRGHPLLVAMRYREEVLRGYDDVGLRGLLRAHPQDVGEVETGVPGVVEDMDVPDDYRRAAAGPADGPPPDTDPRGPRSQGGNHP